MIRVELLIGHLDPVDEITGVQGRLVNLGYDCEVSGVMDEPTMKALRLFQEKNGLTVSGQVEDTTRQKLVEIHEGI